MEITPAVYPPATAIGVVPVAERNPYADAEVRPRPEVAAVEVPTARVETARVEATAVESGPGGESRSRIESAAAVVVVTPTAVEVPTVRSRITTAAASVVIPAATPPAIPAAVEVAATGVRASATTAATRIDEVKFREVCTRLAHALANDDFVSGRELHHFAGGQKWSRGLRAENHQMAEP